MSRKQQIYEKDVYQFQINRTLFYEVVLLSCGCCLTEQYTQVKIPYQQYVDLMTKDSAEVMEF